MAKKVVANAVDVAVGLAKKYIRSKTGGLSEVAFGSVSLDQMTSAINRLAKNDYLTDLSQATTLDDLIGAIKDAQKDFGLTEDGELREDTFDFLMVAKRCFGKLGKRRNRDKDLDGKTLPDVNDDGTKKPLEIRYFIDELPKDKVPKAEQLLMKAWESWSSACGMIATQITDKSNRDKANVIVGMRNIDGASNVLADAHIGPPRSMQLRLSFDRTEPWDETLFEGTACHEIGHLLGMAHRGAVKGDLMYPKYSSSVITPSENDKIRARKIWGEAPPALTPVKKHPGNFIDDDDD